MEIPRRRLSRRRFLIDSAGVALGTGLAGLAVSRSPARAAGQLGATQVARLVGPGSVNQTDARWGVYGTDLGHTFLAGSRVYMVFGDTLGAPAADDFWSVSHADWRSNTMAWIDTTQDPARGLVFGDMVSDQPGHAEELLSSQKVDNVEQTVIPTYGVAVGERLLLHYMSVRHWGAPGHWTLNLSGFAHSDDQGQTWTKDQATTWPGDSNFGQVAIVDMGDFLYLFGIPGGRYGGVQLARVAPADVLSLGAYQYWDGQAWQNAIAAAATIVPAPAGELSVRWSAYYGCWLMMYLDDPAGQIVIRTAPQIEGPWSSPQVVTTSAQYPALYAPYLTPLWNDGPDLYFTMSLYGPYAVYLFRLTLG